MSTNDIASDLAAQCTNIVRAVSPVPVDGIGPSPFAMVADHEGTIEPGNWERIDYLFPVNVYVERTADDARTAETLNDLLDALIAAFRTGIKLAGTVSQALLIGWKTDAYTETETARYKVLQLTVRVTVAQGRAYTA